MTWATDLQQWLDDLPDHPVDWNSMEDAQLIVRAMECEDALYRFRTARAKGMAQPDDFPGFFS